MGKENIDEILNNIKRDLDMLEIWNTYKEVLNCKDPHMISRLMIRIKPKIDKIKMEYDYPTNDEKDSFKKRCRFFEVLYYAVSMQNHLYEISFDQYKNFYRSNLIELKNEIEGKIIDFGRLRR